MEFELAQVPIVRAWFREDFLTSTKWRIKGSANGDSAVKAGDVLSNGDAAHPKGKLFAYPTVVLFARNIKITKSLYDKLSTEANRSSSGSTGWSIGPFSMGGKASYNTTEKNVAVKQVDDKIVMPGMEILGFRNRFLDRLTPNPDKTITKWI